ncbi:efflux RND transporter periplasmic adaptor subunit [Persephonella sp.]
MKKYIAFLLVFVLVGAGIKILKEKKKALENDVKPEPIVVVLEGSTVKEGKLKTYRTFTGSVLPEKIVRVSSKITGNIIKLTVKEGDSVRKDQIIAVVDTRQIEEDIKSLKKELEYLQDQIDINRSKLESAKVNYEYTKNIYERDKILFENKAIPKEAFELSHLKLVKAKTELDVIRKSIDGLKEKIGSVQSKIRSLEVLLEYGTVRSPVDGQVGKVFLYEGSFAVAGKPIIEIYTGRKVVVNIPVDVYNRINKGSTVEITFQDRKIDGFISKKYVTSGMKLPQIEIKSDRLTLTPVGIDLPVQIPLDTVEGFIVPTDSILDLTGKKYVVTGKKGKLVKIPVEVRGIYREKAVVIGDLSEGMVVAVGSDPTLRRALFIGRGKIVTEGKN